MSSIDDKVTLSSGCLICVEEFVYLIGQPGICILVYVSEIDAFLYVYGRRRLQSADRPKLSSFTLKNSLAFIFRSGFVYRSPTTGKFFATVADYGLLLFLCELFNMLFILSVLTLAGAYESAAAFFCRVSMVFSDALFFLKFGKALFANNARHKFASLSAPSAKNSYQRAFQHGSATVRARNGLFELKYINWSNIPHANLFLWNLPIHVCLPLPIWVSNVFIVS